MMTPTRAAVTVAAAAFAAAVVSLLVVEQAWPDAAVNAGNTTSAPGVRLVIRSNRVVGLYPGARAPLILAIENRNRFAVRIRSIDVRVAAITNKRRCRGNRMNIRVIRNWHRRVVVAAESSKRLDSRLGNSTTSMFSVVMPHSVVNACQGATFTLRYAAKATRA